MNEGTKNIKTNVFFPFMMSTNNILKRGGGGGGTEQNYFPLENFECLS